MGGGDTVTLTCAGRPVRRTDNQPTGTTCLARYVGEVESARVLGWRVGPPAADGSRPAMCPACARPGRDEETETTGQVATLEPLPGL